MSDWFGENAAAIRERVRIAAEKAGRSRDEITIVAVSKTFSREHVSIAYDHGFRVFGESRVQEIREKYADAPLPDDAYLHLIGSLQTNKIRQVLPYVDVVQTVDRMSLVDALAKELEKRDQSLEVLLQVNVSGESQKAGLSPADTREVLDAVVAHGCIRPIGLMTMAPLGAADTELRAVFGGLRFLRDELQHRSSVALPVLSMGMSDDFEIAIEEGATHVRLGRSLFGSR